MPARFLRVANQARHADETGVADHLLFGSDRQALDVPASDQDFVRLDLDVLARGPGGLDELAGLDDRRRVSRDPPARSQRSWQMRQHLPGFGQVEHHPIEIGVNHTAVHVTFPKQQVACLGAVYITPIRL